MENMRQKITLLLMLLIFICSEGNGAIIPISKIQEARTCLEDADQDTLVIFDIDRTLVLMGDQLLNSGKAGFIKKASSYPTYNSLTEDEKEILLSIVLLKTSHQLIEKDSLDIITQLQKKSIKTIACTTLETGQFGRITNMEQWRIESLNSLGLNFKSAFRELSDIHFFPEAYRTPIFKEGVLIASKRTKGEIIKLFLEQIEWQPKKIIMIDDQLSALTSVTDELKDIDFQGFHYTYVEELLANQILDEVRINFQMSYLLENHIWLTDVEGSLLLHNLTQ